VLVLELEILPSVECSVDDPIGMVLDELDELDGATLLRRVLISIFTRELNCELSVRFEDVGSNNRFKYL